MVEGWLLTRETQSSNGSHASNPAHATGAAWVCVAVPPAQRMHAPWSGGWLSPPEGSMKLACSWHL